MGVSPTYVQRALRIQRERPDLFGKVWQDTMPTHTALAKTSSLGGLGVLAREIRNSDQSMERDARTLAPATERCATSFSCQGQRQNILTGKLVYLEEVIAEGKITVKPYRS